MTRQTKMCLFMKRLHLRVAYFVAICVTVYSLAQRPLNSTDAYNEPTPAPAEPVRINAAAVATTSFKTTTHDTPVTSTAGPPLLFMDRLQKYLGRRQKWDKASVAAVTPLILKFNIARPVVIDLPESAEWVGITATRWTNMAAKSGQCPNCQVRHRTLGNVNHTVLADVLWNPGCPSGRPVKQKSWQITVGGCGESQAGTGRAYFEAGHRSYDFDASFAAVSGPFQTSYAHLHLLPPSIAMLNDTSDFVAQMLAPRPNVTPGDEVASFVHSNCGGPRGAYVKHAIATAGVQIARYGQCFHNKQITVEPSRKNWFYNDSQANRDGTKTLLASLHPFSFSLENTLSPHYFTEKRYEALLAGSIPVVWGNDNSLQYLPDMNSAVVVSPRDNPHTLKHKLQNATQYLEWKRSGISQRFVKTLFLTDDYLPCRICEYVGHMNLNNNPVKLDKDDT